MRAYAIILCLALVFFKMSAQSWTTIGKFSRTPSKVWYDSLDHRLYVAGNFGWFDSTEVHGFGYVVGDTVIGLGCGFGVDCGANVLYNSQLPVVTGFARFLGQLYVSGQFEKAGGQVVNGIAKWQGGDWVAVGSGLATEGTISHGIGNGLEVMNGELYLYGAFDSINGVEAHGLAKFDGTTWSSVFGLPRFEAGSPNMIQDAEWYQGVLYIGGNFSKPGTNPPLTDLAHWDGIDWVAVGNGITGSYNSVSKLMQFGGKLFIGGGFTYSRNPGSIPGNNITSWDGVNWDTLLGGVLYQGATGVVNEILIHNNELIVGGGFDNAGGVRCNNLAKWDGSKWCGVTENNAYTFGSMSLKSDTIYLAIGSGFVGGLDSISKFARWFGTSFGDTCQLVGVPEEILDAPAIGLFPNPASSSVTVDLPSGIGTALLLVFDVAGREVLPEFIYREGDPPVDVSHLPAGVYVVRLRTRVGVENIKLVVN